VSKNERVYPGNAIPLTVTAGAKSGDPMVVGVLPCHCETDADATTNVASCKLRGIFNYTVNAINAGGNSAVAQGDQLYYTAGDTIKLSKKVAGVPFGVAWEPLAGGATGVIGVIIK
jgi:predicted RecA/RadA family phage recombinase